MTDGFRPMLEHLREAAGLDREWFLERYCFPLLLWPQGRDWREDTPLQFETYKSDYKANASTDKSTSTESQTATTLIVEIRQQATSTPTNMIYVGRAADNDIVLADHTVSKLHAYFLPAEKGGSYQIVDANSTNGTMLNNRRLVPYQNHSIFNGDLIRFGPAIQMVYLSPEGFYELVQKLPQAGGEASANK